MHARRKITLRHSTITREFLADDVTAPAQVLPAEMAAMNPSSREPPGSHTSISPHKIAVVGTGSLGTRIAGKMNFSTQVGGATDHAD